MPPVRLEQGAARSYFESVQQSHCVPHMKCSFIQIIAGIKIEIHFHRKENTFSRMCLKPEGV